jgi:RNA polymerase sigma factor (sigma-70 family)
VRPSSDSVDALFAAEYDAMLRLAYVLTRDQHEAEEIVQDAFVEVTDRWSGILNPGGYLRTAVVNGVRQRGRRDANRRRILETNARAIAPAEHHVDGYDEIVDVLSTLPDNQRIALVLAYYAGMGANEIAATLGCRPGTAKSHVHRGLRRLRKELAGD